MIVTRNGHKISNVVISTIFGIAGNGIFPLTLLPGYRKLQKVAKNTETTILGKSFTFERRIENFVSLKPWTWKYIRPLGKDGLLNAYGLTNGGAKKEIPKIMNSLKIYFTTDRPRKLIPNVYLDFSEGPEDAFYQAKNVLYELHSNLFVHGHYAAEFNFSCPNTREDISKNVNGAIYVCGKIRNIFSDLTIIAKISYIHPYELAEELERIGVDIIHAINTIPYQIVYPNKISPLADAGGGGVSGGPARLHSLKYNAELRKRIKIPIIMGCGVRNMNDIERFEDIGADCVSICTIIRRDSREAIRIIETKNR